MGVEKKEVSIPELTELICNYVEQHSAGSPTDDTLKWTYLQRWEISKYLRETYGHQVSLGCIKRILKTEGWSYRKPAKVLATGKSPVRSAQFDVVYLLITLFMASQNNPIVSIDTKKKELLGTLTRNETLLCKAGQSFKVFDHDYPYLATGKVIPFGIFDYKKNKGYVTLGNSHETADFIVENLQWWWFNHGIDLYPDATNILILCDSGGANGHRHYRFRKLLQDWAADIGLKIIIAHYPPYCSKYNPIERKLFCHLHRTIKNMVLTSLQQIKERFQKATTRKGLEVCVRILDKHFPLKQPSHKEMIDPKRIFYHQDIPHLSYAISP